MQIDKIRTSPYYPACNGKLERFHRTLNAMLAKVVKENQKDWPEHLQTVVAAYRATVHEATLFTPNKVIFGREVRLPVDLLMGPAPDESDGGVSTNDFVNALVERARTDFGIVREYTRKSAASMKRRYDAKLKRSAEIGPGDAVRYFCPRRRQKYCK